MTGYSTETIRAFNNTVDEDFIAICPMRPDKEVERKILCGMTKEAFKQELYFLAVWSSVTRSASFPT
jgi:hypothetical protein